jgi:hypothetical protein
VPELGYLGFSEGAKRVIESTACSGPPSVHGEAIACGGHFHRSVGKQGLSEILLARGPDLALLPDGLVHSLVRALILTLTASRGGQFETRVAQTLHLLPDSFVDQLLPLH